MLKRTKIDPGGSRRMCVLWMMLALLLIAVSGPGLFGQADTGAIAGTVTDATGAVIPGATVTAISTDNGLKLSGVSNGTGEFTILAVPRQL